MAKIDGENRSGILRLDWREESKKKSLLLTGKKKARKKIKTLLSKTGVCPSNSISPSGSIRGLNTTCQCKAGFTGENGAVCSQCAGNTYKIGLGFSICVDCPSFSTFPVGSIINTACQCNAGYAGAN